MTTERQIAANRRNALLSTGPRSEGGKRRSRRNALKHGLTAETVIGSLEDRRTYKALQTEVLRSYAPQTAVERELAARLASLLFRLRRATAIETGLFEIQANILRERRRLAALGTTGTRETVRHLIAAAQSNTGVERLTSADDSQPRADPNGTRTAGPVESARCFLRVANLPNNVIDRIGRYETSLSRQVAQILFILGRPRVVAVSE